MGSKLGNAVLSHIENFLSELGVNVRNETKKDKTWALSTPKGYPRKIEGSSLPAPGIPCVAFGAHLHQAGYSTMEAA